MKKKLVVLGIFCVLFAGIAFAEGSQEATPFIIPDTPSTITIEPSSSTYIAPPANTPSSPSYNAPPANTPSSGLELSDILDFANKTIDTINKINGDRNTSTPSAPPVYTPSAPAFTAPPQPMTIQSSGVINMRCQSMFTGDSNVNYSGNISSASFHQTSYNTIVVTFYYYDGTIIYHNFHNVTTSPDGNRGTADIFITTNVGQRFDNLRASFTISTGNFSYTMSHKLTNKYWGLVGLTTN